ncbi:MAG: NAD(P)-dependent oxidoreductase [Bacteroidota bacterium]
MTHRYALFLQKPDVLDRQRTHLEELFDRYMPGTARHFAGKPEEIPSGKAFDLVITPQLDWLSQALERIPRPDRIHLTSSGRDILDAMELDLNGITVTTSSGVNATAIAEYVIGGILMHAKQFHLFRDRQHRRSWQRSWLSELSGTRLGIVGLGNIGTRVVTRAVPFGFSIRGCDVRQDELEGVEQVYGVANVGELAAWCDILVLSVPLTPQTRGLIDAGILGRMRPGSLLINVSRGPVVDEPDLVKALRSGIPTGAVLDVFEEEPLPPEHPFWTMPQVVITPHVAGTTQHYMENMFDTIVRKSVDDQPGMHQAAGSKSRVIE